MALTLNASNPDSSEPEIMVDINTTPLIDVMLVLLVMLIITIPLQTQSVNINMPQANTTVPAVKPHVDEIDIEFDGTILWNGEVMQNRRDLATKLTAVASQSNQPEVHVRPDRLADYKYMAEVLAEAQRLGVQKIGIVGFSQYSK